MNSGFRYIGKSAMPDFPENVIKSFLDDPCHFKIQRGTSREFAPVHTHNYMQLWYVLRGSFRHAMDGQWFNHSKGDFLIVPAYFTHQIDTSQSEDVEFIFCDISEGFLDIFNDSKEKNMLFNLAYLRPLFVKAANMKPFLSFPPPIASQLEELFIKLWDEYNNFTNLSPTYLRVTLVQLLTLVTREYEAIPPQNENILLNKYRAAMQDALDYIDSHYTDNIYLNDIAKTALMSTHSFSCIFKQITGKTLIEYIRYLRTRHAQKLLTDTDRSILSISMECGYHDIAYFCRVFKKITGLSPSEYRKKGLVTKGQ